jgi:hypothetical protein
MSAKLSSNNECRYCHEFGHTVVRCPTILNINVNADLNVNACPPLQYMKPQYTKLNTSETYMLHVRPEQDRLDIREMNDRIRNIKGKSWADEE